jgi:hypothetical protein
VRNLSYLEPGDVCGGAGRGIDPTDRKGTPTRSRDRGQMKFPATAGSTSTRNPPGASRAYGIATMIGTGQGGDDNEQYSDHSDHIQRVLGRRERCSHANNSCAGHQEGSPRDHHQVERKPLIRCPIDVHQVRYDGGGMKDMVLMNSDLAATIAMSASDRADIAREDEELRRARRTLARC